MGTARPRSTMARLGAIPIILLFVLQLDATGRGQANRPECDLRKDELDDHNATLQNCSLDNSFCHLGGVIPVYGPACPVNCSRGHHLINKLHNPVAPNLIKCLSGGRGLQWDFECAACPPNTYKNTVGNTECSACKAGQTTTAWPPWPGDGAQTCRPAGADWCRGTLPVAHSRDDACSAQAGRVSNGGAKIKPGDICTIDASYNPFDPGWIRTDREKHTFKCGLDGEWSQISSDPLTPQRGVCSASSCFTTPKKWGETGCHKCGDPAYAEGIACGNCSGQHHLGDVCMVGCADGYRPKASSGAEYWTGDMICDAEEQWVPEGSAGWTRPYVIDYTRFCEKITCDPMPQPVRESKRTSIDPRCTARQVEDGVTCSATCISGYYRSSGNSSRTCIRGKWSGEPLVCTQNDRCASSFGTSGWQEHSRLVDTTCDTRCGQSCTVGCVAGYNRSSGPAPFEVQCQCSKPNAAGYQPDNEWVLLDRKSDPPGSCLGCRNKGELVPCVCDGRPTSNSESCRGLGGDTCEVECDAGYHLSRGGHATVLCERRSGTWTGSGDCVPDRLRRDNGGNLEGDFLRAVLYLVVLAALVAVTCTGVLRDIASIQSATELCYVFFVMLHTVLVGGSMATIPISIYCATDVFLSHEISSAIGGIVTLVATSIVVPVIAAGGHFCIRNNWRLAKTRAALPAKPMAALVFSTVLAVAVACLIPGREPCLFSVVPMVLCGGSVMAYWYARAQADLQRSSWSADSSQDSCKCSMLKPIAALVLSTGLAAVLSFAYVHSARSCHDSTDCEVAGDTCDNTTRTCRTPSGGRACSSAADCDWVGGYEHCDVSTSKCTPNHEVALPFLSWPGVLPLVALCGGSVLASWCARADLRRSSGSADRPQDTGRCSVIMSAPSITISTLLRLLGNMLEELPLDTRGALSPDALEEQLMMSRKNENAPSQISRTRSGGRQVISFTEITDLSTIASGAYGTVYRGYWRSGGMTVALKIARKSPTTGLYSSVRETAGHAISSSETHEFSAGTNGRFAQEIQFSEGAAHRNIVQCFGITSGVFPPATHQQDALVMEFVPTTLYQRLHRDADGGQKAGGFSSDVRRSVAAGIVSGMIFLHKHKKVAHLDLKSHNILMDQDRPKIADFGLTVETAQSLRTTATELWVSHGTKSGGVESSYTAFSAEPAALLVPLDNVRGTGAWMAPEMMTREVEVTTKADVYSFGVVMWELVSPNVDLIGAWETAAFGQDHWLRNTAIIPTWAANGIRPAIPAAVTAQDQDWEEAIGECWQTDPDKRPSFGRLSRRSLFRESSSDNGRQQRREGSGSVAVVADVDAAAAMEVEPEVPVQPPPQGPLLSTASLDLYASETEVSSWLKMAGLGHRVAAAAASDEDFCDLEVFESIALSLGAEAAAAQAEFIERMGLTDGEKVLFASALEQLKLRLLETRDGQDVSRGVPLAASRPASPPSFATAGAVGGTGVSRPASPSPGAAMPEFDGGAE